MSRKWRVRFGRLWKLWRVGRRMAEGAVSTDIVPLNPPAPPAISYRRNKYSGLSVEEALKRAPKVKIYEEDGDRMMAFSPRGWHAEESFATPRSAEHIALRARLRVDHIAEHGRPIDKSTTLGDK